MFDAYLVDLLAKMFVVTDRQTDRLTDRLTDRQTLAFLELLLQLKSYSGVIIDWVIPF